ncbi:MAG: PEP-CTERM sorting domain-containing protein [Desulfobulbaceae bacterium]|nr:PEP-CTERM sorting domain-containing protein [Desulfobulbaceae bacterium]
MFSTFSNATTYDITVSGGDAIWLAGRTDLVIPPAGVIWPGGLARHPTTPELIQETLPPGISVSGGDVVRVLDPAIGGISFFNGFGGTIYGPDGNGLPGDSTLGSFGGISGYKGTQGALAGVFLDDSIPNGAAPASLDFSLTGLGIEFTTLSPDLQQVFFIGDGVTSGNIFQEFTAPTGATRVFFGVTDGFAFVGPPGAYDDNDGLYRIRVGVNQIPDPIPEPTTMLLFGTGIAGLAAVGRRRRS